MKCEIKECHGSFTDKYYCLVLSELNSVTDGKITNEYQFYLKFSSHQYSQISNLLGADDKHEGNNPEILKLFKVLQWRLNK